MSEYDTYEFAPLCCLSLQDNSLYESDVEDDWEDRAPAPKRAKKSLTDDDDDEHTEDTEEEVAETTNKTEKNAKPVPVTPKPPEVKKYVKPWQKVIGSAVFEVYDFNKSSATCTAKGSGSTKSDGDAGKCDSSPGNLSQNASGWHGDSSGRTSHSSGQVSHSDGHSNSAERRKSSDNVNSLETAPSCLKSSNNGNKAGGVHFDYAAPVTNANTRCYKGATSTFSSSSSFSPTSSSSCTATCPDGVKSQPGSIEAALEATAAAAAAQQGNLQNHHPQPPVACNNNNCAIGPTCKKCALAATTTDHLALNLKPQPVCHDICCRVSPRLSSGSYDTDSDWYLSSPESIDIKAVQSTSMVGTWGLASPTLRVQDSGLTSPVIKVQDMGSLPPTPTSLPSESEESPSEGETKSPSLLVAGNSHSSDRNSTVGNNSSSKCVVGNAAVRTLGLLSLTPPNPDNTWLSPGVSSSLSPGAGALSPGGGGGVSPSEDRWWRVPLKKRWLPQTPDYHGQVLVTDVTYDCETVTFMESSTSTGFFST